MTPIIEDGNLRNGPGGLLVGVQEVQFDASTRLVGLVDNSPFMQQMYDNTIIDATNFSGDFAPFKYLYADRSPIGKISLACAHKRLLISQNYVVSVVGPERAGNDPSSYCARVQFAKGPECNKPDSVVTLKRNDEAASPLADTTFMHINRKVDVVTWSIARGGVVVKTGSFGFPIVGTEAGLVTYTVRLP